MPWVLQDDHFFHNRKARAVGPEGRELYMAALGYCNIQLNDGCFVVEDVPVIAALAQVEPSIADRLFDQGMWHPEGVDCIKCRAVGQPMPVPAGHIAVHEYFPTNKSRDRVLADREANAERQRRSRTKSRRDSHSDSDGSNAVSSAAPLPVPFPTELSVLSSSGNSRSDPQPVDEEIPSATWQRYAELMLERQPAGRVKNATTWKAKARKNAKEDHGDTALRWWRDFDVTPHHLAECLVDGKAPRGDLRRKDPA